MSSAITRRLRGVHTAWNFGCTVIFGGEGGLRKVGLGDIPHLTRRYIFGGRMQFPTDRIYKFSSFSENSISALASKSAWFSNVGKLNDPFEAFVSYQEPRTEDERISRCVKFAAKSLELESKLSKNDAFELVLKRYIENQEEFLKVTAELIRNALQQKKDYLHSLCVYSTSVDLPDHPPHYSNMLMWAHYGCGFSGFCLQFSADKFNKSINELNDGVQVYPRAMRYVDKALVFNPVDLLGNGNFQYVDAIQTKHEQWDYEGEVRFISKSVGLHRYSAESLEAVYIGAKMPQGQRHVLIAIVKTYFPHAKILEVKINNSGYEVVANEI